MFLICSYITADSVVFYQYQKTSTTHCDETDIKFTYFLRNFVKAVSVEPSVQNMAAPTAALAPHLTGKRVAPLNDETRLLM